MNEWTTQQLGAWAEEKSARYAGMLESPRRALDGVALSHWEDREDLAVNLTSHLVDQARYELARSKPGRPPDDLEAAMLALSGGERDPLS